ncbi:CHAT domain-containing protein [Actinospica durhamensis]|uniref:CHAT domain-containing protein n=1 Tax=Actinospica durhamensis TaxID=1508375 RepID=A0A941IRF5_9ACTN|nr:CHAT domain-containing protein [Actinospica durhamensis]MBR7838740.1 CHAT domain-containing protein [Actinospica durhamensis]
MTARGGCLCVHALGLCCIAALICLQIRTIGHVPSLNLLRPATPAIVGGRVLAYVDDEAAEQLDKGDVEVAYWRRLDSAGFLTRARTRAESQEELSSSSWDGLYLVAHGDGDGLAQGIKFTEGGTLSAATALTHRWPRSIVFASCFVAKVEQPSGREPFGLAIACMLGGCRTMVSGVIEVERAATSIIAADVAVALNSAAPAATALRSAQLAYLESVGIELAFVNQWAGLICLSTEWSTAPR